MEFKGYFINLASKKDRRLSLEKHLKEVNLFNNFERFEAIKPKSNQDLNGLKTKGEYGVWLSYLTLFEKIIEDENNKIFLIIEDDFRFNNDALSILKTILSTEEFKSQDILFLDYLINMQILEQFLSIENNRKKFFKNEKNFYFSSAAHWYAACMSCFLINKSNSLYLFKMLQNLFDNLSAENKLIPVDMALKNLIKIRALNGSILIPPLGAPDWDLDKVSSIQTNYNNEIRNSMRAYLLLRLAASGVESPTFCISRFSELINKNISSKPPFKLKDFYKYVLSNQNLLNHNW